MKKFTKLFLSCALVSALAASTAVMASATELVTKTNGLAGSYDAGTLSLNTENLAFGGVKEGTQATLLVVAGDKYTDENSVVGIDQEEDAEFTKTGLKGAPTEAPVGGTGFTVMLGYYPADNSEFKIATATLFAPEATGEKRLIGDINLNAKVDTNDAGFAARKAVGGTTKINKAGLAYTITVNFDETNTAGKDYIIGDVNLNGKVDTNDAGFIARKAVGGTTKINKAGQEITIAEKAE